MSAKNNENLYLVAANIFKGELWSNSTPHGSVSGPITGVIETLFRRLAMKDPAKSQELLKSLIDIQYDIGSD